MRPETLAHDPYNIIITGVGGQGNVLASRLLGGMLSQRGYRITIGETFGASQRGGAVMSHLRVSSDASFSPQIPRGGCHLVAALEPLEALRVLRDYGNPDTLAISNTRPVHPVGVIAGDLAYPEATNIRQWIGELTHRAWLIGFTDEALKLGSPLYANVMLVGAIAGIGALPLRQGDFEAVIAHSLPSGTREVNLQAFARGGELVRDPRAGAPA